MDTLEIHEPAPDLSRLMERVSAGEPFMLTFDGKFVAQVRPLRNAAEAGSYPQGVSPLQLGVSRGKPRQPGALKGMFNVPDDFDTMFQAEIEEMFYGES